ncbi:hypothetical protein ACIQV0_18200 [Lysinibacillus capsici]
MAVALEEKINTTTEDIKKSFEELKKNNPEIIDLDFEEIDNLDGL